MTIAILDYGVGNFHSLRKALARERRDVRIVADPRRALAAASVLVLPGVGAFTAAARRIADVRVSLREALRDGLPCLAICLGMQLLFERSEEGPGYGLGLIPGVVTRLTTPIAPHMGWSTLERSAGDLAMTSHPSVAYFAHSFVCRPCDPTIVRAWTSFGEDRFPSIVRTRNTIGVQFHPEKSSSAGLRFIAAVLATFEREGAAP